MGAEEILILTSMEKEDLLDGETSTLRQGMLICLQGRRAINRSDLLHDRSRGSTRHQTMKWSSVPHGQHRLPYSSSYRLFPTVERPPPPSSFLTPTVCSVTSLRQALALCPYSSLFTPFSGPSGTNKPPLFLLVTYPHFISKGVHDSVRQTMRLSETAVFEATLQRRKYITFVSPAVKMVVR